MWTAPTLLLAIDAATGITPDSVRDALRRGEPPIMVRVHRGELLVDPHCLRGDEASLKAGASGKSCSTAAPVLTPETQGDCEWSSGLSCTRGRREPSPAGPFWSAPRPSASRRRPAGGPIATGAAAQTTQKRELIIAQGGDLSRLDPHFSTSSNDIRVTFNVFDNLTNRHPDGKLQPGLATEWKATAPTTWTFKLRQGVKFHNGDPCTSDDVKFSISGRTTPTSRPWSRASSPP